ncbi:hypothetical protein [uncultured Brevibacillus sp.]|uniref:hypothetical protein n=1 Tax=uncultured Brevibacillus sp. TaxID=169970 RepID=UPI0025929444|nr:hypothetical protein [uncultured Brevibacillus sp.]
MSTTEFVNGKLVPVNADFRAYLTGTESIADHSALILTSTRDQPKGAVDSKQKQTSRFRMSHTMQPMHFLGCGGIPR